MLRVALDCVMCGLLLTVPVGISTYIAMGADHLLADEALARMDATLGFDWNGLIRFVDARWLLAEALLQAYQSFALQLVLVPVLLAVFSQPARAYAMVTSYGVLCFASSLISVWYPAWELTRLTAAQRNPSRTSMHISGSPSWSSFTRFVTTQPSSSQWRG